MIFDTHILFRFRVKQALLFLVLVGTCSFGFSQNDSTAAVEPDTVTKVHSPKKAVTYSALLPGLGQVYNKKYWKVPLIYGLGGTATYFIFSNRRNYQDFKSAYITRIDGDSTTIDNYVDIYTDANLFTLQDTYRRYMEISYIAVAVVYVLQLVDASVDAHLFSFDVSPDLSLNFQPTLLNDYSTSRPISGLTLSLKL